MSYYVRFKDVGRGKACFSVSMTTLSHRTLLKAVRPHLASREIEFMLSDDRKPTGDGSILAGFHTVGRFTWEVTP